MEKLVKMKKFGMLSVGQDSYVLLRPTRFEREHYKFTENEVSFYVAYLDEIVPDVWKVFTPHVLTICNEGFHVDIAPHPSEIDVLVYGEEEQENTLNDFRPIDMIATADEDLPIS